MSNTHSVLLSPAVLTLIMTLMPFIRSDYRTFRVFDFPRLQKEVLEPTREDVEVAREKRNAT